MKGGHPPSQISCCSSWNQEVMYCLGGRSGTAALTRRNYEDFTACGCFFPLETRKGPPKPLTPSEQAARKGRKQHSESRSKWPRLFISKMTHVKHADKFEDAIFCKRANSYSPWSQRPNLHSIPGVTSVNLMCGRPRPRPVFHLWVPALLHQGECSGCRRPLGSLFCPPGASPPALSFYLWGVGGKGRSILFLLRYNIHGVMCANLKVAAQ